MKIENEFKQYCLSIAEIVIDKFYRKDFENTIQELLNYDATTLKVAIEKSQEAIDSLEKNKPIGLSEDFLIIAIANKSLLFNIAYELNESNYKTDEITYEEIYLKWTTIKNERDHKQGIERYFKTNDPLFNQNAYYWHIELRQSKLFDKIEVAFQILKEYLRFKFKYKEPITTINRIDKLMFDQNLNKDQILFIYDKLCGLIANADIQIQNNLSLIRLELTIRRIELEPYDLSEEIKKYDLDLILEESKKEESIEDQIAFLRKKQLALKGENDETGFLDEIVNLLQIDIDSLYLKLKFSETKELNIKEDLEIIINQQSEILNSVDSLGNQFKDYHKQNKENFDKIEKEIDSNFHKLFKSNDERTDILQRLDNIAKEQNVQDWQNRPLKSKLKVMLPLILFKYEREMDISDFKFPNNWVEFKELFISKM